MSQIQYKTPNMKTDYPIRGSAFLPGTEWLKFGHGNSKLDAGIATFSLPAGHACPFARECLSKWDYRQGKTVDGKHNKFRCYAVNAEAMYPSVRNSRKRNFGLLRALKDPKLIADLILESLPKTEKIVRIHESGDFYSAAYFEGWMLAAGKRPQTRFYAYTKALPIWVEHLGLIPDNVNLTASYGGTHDHLIKEHNLKSALVVFSVEQAEKLGLEIDHDDSHAIWGTQSFALLLHSPQPAGSIAAKALSALKAAGWTGYSRKP